ncbi:MAG: 16S rRNA (cytidine(1402)-2'-O)-methyltransferase [Nitrospinota bacterium]|nr:16S rRNA (cytidine(1402)-2'-O)-methyltransferase [Nitrospinota bacterium]
MPDLNPGIYLVSTPIGNLADLSERQIEVLNDCDLIACEDTRRSKTLLFKLKIKKPLISYHEHNELNMSGILVEHVLNGKSIAVISDAGTPGISDPAYRVVVEGIRNEVPIIPIPGPSSIIAALVASGLPTDSFIFDGFLPQKGEKRKKKIHMLLNEKRTIVLFESPHRINRLVNEIVTEDPERLIVIARELTKVYEEFIRGTAFQVSQLLNKRKLKGECVVIIDRKK